MSSQLPARMPVGGHILLVDDAPAIAELVRYVLESEGHVLSYASTLAAATAALRAEHYDLVLADGLSERAEVAWDTAKRVLKRARTTPVALFTAHPVDRAAARAAGFAAVIPKPFDLDNFLRQIRALTTDRPSGG